MSFSTLKCVWLWVSELLGFDVKRQFDSLGSYPCECMCVCTCFWINVSLRSGCVWRKCMRWYFLFCGLTIFKQRLDFDGVLTGSQQGHYSFTLFTDIVLFSHYLPLKVLKVKMLCCVSGSFQYWRKKWNTLFKLFLKILSHQTCSPALGLAFCTFQWVSVAVFIPVD